MRVGRFGLHHVGGVSFLVQNQIDHALPVPMQTPFHFDKPPGRCPHDINLQRRAPVPENNDPLWQLFLPQPSKGVYALHNNRPQFGPSREEEILVQLVRLYSCVELTSRPLWNTSIADLYEALTITNLGVVVISCVELQSLPKLYRIIDGLPANSRALLLLTDTPKLFMDRHISPIKTELNSAELRQMPLEQIGAEHLWRLMRAPARSAG
jgi:hypothetical protein